MVTAGPATLEIDEVSARFSLADVVVGEYVLNDSHKPHLHPLRTLGGRVVSLAKPFDHRHHKGLMYAVTATDVNWWEEQGSDDYVPVIGVQRQESIEESAPGTIRQTLRWTAEDGSRETFRENREISCSWDAAGFVRWTWRGEFTVLRDVTLRHSLWAAPDSAGRPTNYHGLGLRFARTFGWTEHSGTWAGPDGPSDPAALMGTRPATVTVSDLLDGEIPAPRASVRFTQPESSHAVFAMRTPFTYLSMGPSIASPVDFVAGETFAEKYFVDVTDAVFS